MSDFAKDTNVPTNDCISRQAAINAIENTDCELSADAWDELTDSIMQLPSVEKKVVMKMDAVATGITFTPNKHIGKWEERSVFEGEIQQWQSARCSVCNKYHTTPYLYYFDNFNYCPNCGAKMEASE